MHFSHFSHQSVENDVTGPPKLKWRHGIPCFTHQLMLPYRRPQNFYQLLKGNWRHRPVGETDGVESWLYVIKWINSRTVCKSECVHKRQCHFAGTTTVITGNRVRRSMSSSKSRRQEVTEQMWYVAEDCSRSVQRRLEKLGRRRLSSLSLSSFKHHLKTFFISFYYSYSTRSAFGVLLQKTRYINSLLLLLLLLRVGYGEPTVRETKRNADAFETQTLLDDEVRQRGMTVPGHEDIKTRTASL